MHLGNVLGNIPAAVCNHPCADERDERNRQNHTHTGGNALYDLDCHVEQIDELYRLISDVNITGLFVALYNRNDLCFDKAAAAVFHFWAIQCNLQTFEQHYTGGIRGGA